MAKCFATLPQFETNFTMSQFFQVSPKIQSVWMTRLMTQHTRTDNGAKLSTASPAVKMNVLMLVQTKEALEAREKLETDVSSTTPVPGSEPPTLPSEADSERAPAFLPPIETPSGDAKLSDTGHSCRSDDAWDAEGGSFDPDYRDGGVAVRPRRKLRRKTQAEAASCGAAKDDATPACKPPAQADRHPYPAAIDPPPLVAENSTVEAVR